MPESKKPTPPKPHKGGSNVEIGQHKTIDENRDMIRQDSNTVTNRVIPPPIPKRPPGK